MTYDDMPVGTVLLDIDTGTVFVRTNTRWMLVRRNSSTSGRYTHDLPPGLVELVAKPATLVDGQGYRWEPPVEPVYRIRLDQGFSDWLTRAEIEAEDGPLTEATE